MLSLRDYPLWFYKIFTLKNLQTIYPSNSYNLFREVAFSIRAGCFLFSSRLLSLFEQSIFTLQHYQIPQEKTQEQAKPTTFLQAKAHNLPTSKLTTIQQAKLTTFQQAKAHSLQQTKPTTFLQAKSTAILQAKAHSHTTSLLLKKTLRKQANPAKYPQYSTL